MVPMHVFSTSRLQVHTASLDNIDFYLDLWTCPEVMKFVGFPHGLLISRTEIQALLEKHNDDLPFGSLLVVIQSETQQVIGECKLYRPDPKGISRTDIKLLPPYWGRGYGKELKQALINYLFDHTDCIAVEGTPNIDNIASIKMQEAVGGVRVGENISTFPDSMQDYTTPVHHYIYYVYRPGYQPDEL